MKAVFQTQFPAPWEDALPGYPWPLLPLGGRPMILTWIESAVAAGCEEIVVVLGGAAPAIEALCGDGTAWGCHIQYRFQRPEPTPDEVLVTGPAFVSPKGHTLHVRPMLSLGDLHGFNMDIASGRSELAVLPGYQSVPGECVGLDVHVSPSSRSERPFVVGDHARLASFCTIGPEAVLGRHVVVGRGSRVARSLILDHTHIGQGLEIDGKIVAGNRLIDPATGIQLELDDLLLADRRGRDGLREGLGVFGGRVAAMCLLVLGYVPWLFVRKRFPFQSRTVLDRRGRPFELAECSSVAGLARRLGLDRVDRLRHVVAGRLSLCGHEPFLADEAGLAEGLGHPRPAAFVLNDTDEPLLKLFDARVAEADRTFAFAWRTWRACMVRRQREAPSDAPAPQEAPA